jgi:hypothetical protein
VIQFLEKWTTALGKPTISPNISAWRRKVAGDLTDVPPVHRRPVEFGQGRGRAGHGASRHDRRGHGLRHHRDHQRLRRGQAAHVPRRPAPQRHAQRRPAGHRGRPVRRDGHRQRRRVVGAAVPRMPCQPGGRPRNPRPSPEGRPSGTTRLRLFSCLRKKSG